MTAVDTGPPQTRWSKLGGIVANVGGAIALNANSAYQMVAALSADRPEVVLAAVTADFPRPLAMLYSGRLSFLLWAHALEQGYLTTTALLYGHGTPLPRETGLFAGPTQITIQPTVVTQEAVQQLVEGGNVFGTTLPAWIDALQRAIDAEPPSNSSEYGSLNRRLIADRYLRGACGCGNQRSRRHGPATRRSRAQAEWVASRLNVDAI